MHIAPHACSFLSSCIDILCIIDCLTVRAWQEKGNVSIVTLMGGIMIFIF